MMAKESMAEALARLLAPAAAPAPEALEKAAPRPKAKLATFEGKALEHIRRTLVAQYKATLAAIQKDVEEVLRRP